MKNATASASRHTDDIASSDTLNAKRINNKNRKRKEKVGELKRLEEITCLSAPSLRANPHLSGSLGPPPSSFSSCFCLLSLFVALYECHKPWATSMWQHLLSARAATDTQHTPSIPPLHPDSCANLHYDQPVCFHLNRDIIKQFPELHCLHSRTFSSLMACVCACVVIALALPMGQQYCSSFNKSCVFGKALLGALLCEKAVKMVGEKTESARARERESGRERIALGRGGCWLQCHCRPSEERHLLFDSFNIQQQQQRRRRQQAFPCLSRSLSLFQHTLPSLRFPAHHPTHDL